MDKKPNVIYHGSSKKIIGETINPSQGDDSDERPDNKLFGVYAADRKDFAIVMGIFSCKDVIGGSIDSFTKNSMDVKIYGKLPKQKYIYLYTLPAKTFNPSKAIKHQFVSKVAVKPIKIEKVLISDYVHLLKRATKKETKEWVKKYIK